MATGVNRLLLCENVTLMLEKVDTRCTNMGTKEHCLYGGGGGGGGLIYVCVCCICVCMYVAMIQCSMMSIRSLQAPQYWNHCDGVSNSADIPSRGRSLSDPAMLPLQLNGPDWLSTSVKFDQLLETMPDECVAEMKYTTPGI